MRDTKRVRPKGTDSELSTDQGSSSLELYYDGLERKARQDPSRCTVCGRPDDGNLSHPFGRCWTCITGESPEAAQARRYARPTPQATPPAPEHAGDPALYVRLFWPDRDDNRPLFLRVARPRLTRPDDDPDDNRPRFMRELRPRRRPGPYTPPTTGTSGDVGRRLTGILTHLNQATVGARNATLHWSACRVGEMIAAGELHDPDAAADALADVALGIGLDPREVRGTIRSGFRTSGVAA